MSDTRVRLSTLIIVTTIASAAAFAAGRSTSSSPATAAVQPEHDHDHRGSESLPVEGNALPHDHPATTGDLPPGHPPIDPGAVPPTAPASSAAAASLEWKVPPRWVVVPNTSSMRIATYRVPRAPGDSADADVSVSQAGGAVAANVERWIGQFDAEGQKTAKRSTRKVAGLEVTVVEVEGTYNGGMSGGSETGWALLGAIVATPGMPHFFKITGPAKTVASAKGELDALIASLTTGSK